LNNANLLTGFDNGGIKSFYIASYSYATGTKFFKSNDNGITWSAGGTVAEGYFSRTSFNCSQLTEGRLFYGGVNCYRSSNGGNSWLLINEWWEYYGSEASKLHADIPYIQAFLNPVTLQETLLISTDGGLYKSSDNAISNTNITMTGMRNAQYYDIYTYRYLPEIIFAGSQDQGYQRSSFAIDDNYYFDQLISGDYGHLVSANGGDHLWMVYPGFAMLHKNASAGGDLFFWDFVGSGHLWLSPE
jgi:hypothetical protein